VLGTVVCNQVLLNLINMTENLSLRLIALHQCMCSLNLFPRELFLNGHFERSIDELWRGKLDQEIPELTLILQIPTPQPTAFPAYPFILTIQYPI
jgi:hypothetical protein